MPGHELLKSIGMGIRLENHCKRDLLQGPDTLAKTEQDRVPFHESELNRYVTRG